jgi:hypothetical protein
MRLVYDEEERRNTYCVAFHQDGCFFGQFFIELEIVTEKGGYIVCL